MVKAFPSLYVHFNKTDEMSEPRLVANSHHGMDLRDYFAAKAMQAMIQNSALLEDKSSSTYSAFETFDFAHAVICGVNSEIDLDDMGRGKYTWAQYYAEEAYCIADAMMKARGIDNERQV